ncbi:RNA polymerase recycling motor HelD [Bacillus sp. MRMR6]|uniref:RNA polymerase recycling motor HelD n=1 Tax=Bacillus sp. MRMR6 TaxID=1928617 RepID=UPI0009522959|nr:RNA polymerase recycling motor HelD [Bacillus sp. MRMR6]OLS39908.1 helicase [Bacillus sp. MRMR6]
MSDVQRNNWKDEQNRVNFILKQIKSKVDKLQKSSGKIRTDVLDIRKLFWEDVTVNFDEPDDKIESAASIKQQAELLSERERTYRQVDQQLNTLSRLYSSPYFGRIDFKENGEAKADQIYLGISSFMDEDDQDFLIYDWRAPISSLYYDFSPGSAQYKTLDGLIEGEMELKRQFIIRTGEIKAMFETGVTIGDEMLQEVLGNNANTQMKSIVATIQQEQNKIIRNEKSRLLIVQGVAGSGKTSAALQRVAYLLYRYRDTIKSENIMLFSPNPLFNSYVATVLPELGEENMQQVTFMEYLHHRIGKGVVVEDAFDQMEYLLNGEINQEGYHTRVEGIRFKGSLTFKNIIDQFVVELSKRGLLFKDLHFRGEVFISKEDIYDHFYSLDKDISIPNRMEHVKEWLLRELKRKVRKERVESWVEEEIQFLDKEDYLEAFKKLQEKSRYTDNSFDDFAQEQKLLAEMVVKEKFKPLFKRVKRLKFIDTLGLYHMLFEKGINHQEILLDQWEQICNQTINQLTNHSLSYEDATSYVYLMDLIEGRKSNTGIRHIFVDEAQDYTPFQFAYLQKLFPYSKMTLLGDFNQAIFSGATGSENALTDLLEEGEDTERIVLSKTYRSTKEIVEFTSSLIDGGEWIEPFNRKGTKPAVKKAVQPLNHLIASKIREFQDKGHRTIAVICRTANDSKKVYTDLKKEVSLHLIEKGTLSYEKGILVIPSYLAKGIEFDAVIISDISLYSNESERKLFYTVCTRAMHELYMFTTGDISPLMRTTSRELFYYD